MAIRKKFIDYRPASEANMDLDACTDEILREITVRKRLYDRWLDEAKHTWTEGDTRMRALMGALRYLHSLAKPVAAAAGAPFPGTVAEGFAQTRAAVDNLEIDRDSGDC